MSKQFCSAVTSLLVSALKHGHAVLLEDEASFACSLFLGIGADRQSLMLPAIEGCGHDRDKYFDREHPEKDPYVGLNERLTAGRNPSRQAAS